MKRRKYIALVMAGMLALAVPSTGYADENYNVWIEEADVEYNEAEWKVKVMTDGKSSDGLLEISYNTSLLSVEEEDVHLSENVDMSSVNITEAGKLKIAYLAEDTVEKGMLAEIPFTVIGKNVTIDALGLTGEVYDPEGKEMNVGIVRKETDSQKPESPGMDEEETTDVVQNTDTGDSRHVELWLMTMAVALGITGGIVIKKIK